MVKTTKELNISERIRWLGSSDGFVTPSLANPTPSRGIERHWVDILPQIADQTLVLAGDKFHQTCGFPLLSGGDLLGALGQGGGWQGRRVVISNLDSVAVNASIAASNVGPRSTAP